MKTLAGIRRRKLAPKTKTTTAGRTSKAPKAPAKKTATAKKANGADPKTVQTQLQVEIGTTKDGQVTLGFVAEDGNGPVFMFEPAEAAMIGRKLIEASKAKA